MERVKTRLGFALFFALFNVGLMAFGNGASAEYKSGICGMCGGEQGTYPCCRTTVCDTRYHDNCCDYGVECETHQT